MKPRIQKRKAFTLVEILIVICVISILFVVLVSRVDFTTDKARNTGVQTDFRAFQTAAHQVAVEDGKLVDDLNHLAGTNFTIDPCEGNMLINPTTGRFYIIDLRPVKKIRNVGDLILLLLTDIPDMPDNAEYFELEQKIVNKLMRAAQSCGLSVPEQLKLKPRALEVIKSEAARQLYKNNYQNIALHTHSK